MTRHRAIGLLAAVLLASACGADRSAGAAPRPAGLASADAVRVTATTAASGAGTATDPSFGVPPSPTGPTSTTSAEPLRIMPLGDSLTQGDDPTDPSKPQTYRGALETRLREAGLSFDLVGSDTTPSFGGTDFDNEGHGGYTIGPDASVLCNGCPPANLDANLETWLAAARPDVVVLLVGVNDLFPIEPAANGVHRPVDPDDAPAKLQALVGRILALAPQADVFVASYPPLELFASTDAETGARFAALNEAARTAGSQGGRAHYIPVAEELAGTWTPDDDIADGVHPSTSGAAKIAEVIAGALLSSAAAG
ncbi:MAG: SGNH/GDSL hydrolase family protein [Acidimicrobiia bacterium]